jgi:hypothetical protein
MIDVVQKKSSIFIGSPNVVTAEAGANSSTWGLSAAVTRTVAVS